jgi:hypothetical protein
MHRSWSIHAASLRAAALLSLGAALLATPVAAQPGTAPQLVQSTRATVAAILSGRMIGGRWLPNAAGLAGPSEIRIDYGQPHARGRRVFGVVVPWDSVWRTGANLATTLTTDVDVMIGDALVPRGTYTLFTIPSRRGSTLIVSRQTGQWGTDYDARQDLVRVDLRTRTLSEPVESLTFYLVPANDRSPRGVLRIVWGDVELSTDWRVR